MTVEIGLREVVIVTTGVSWYAAMKVPASHQLNPFNTWLAMALFVIPVWTWGVFFLGAWLGR